MFQHTPSACDKAEKDERPQGHQVDEELYRRPQQDAEPHIELVNKITGSPILVDGHCGGHGVERAVPPRGYERGPNNCGNANKTHQYPIRERTYEHHNQRDERIGEHDIAVKQKHRVQGTDDRQCPVPAGQNDARIPGGGASVLFPHENHADAIP